MDRRRKGGIEVRREGKESLRVKEEKEEGEKNKTKQKRKGGRNQERISKTP